MFDTTLPFSTWLKVQRVQRGLTQKQMADSLQINHNTVSLWETGQSLPTDALIQRIAKFTSSPIQPLLIKIVNERSARGRS